MAEDDARKSILGAIRRGLAKSGDEATRRSAVAERLSVHRRNLVPKRADLDRKGQVDLFRAQGEAVHVSFDRVASPGDVPSAISDYLRRLNLPQRLRHGADPLICGLPWAQRTPTLEVKTGRADPADEVSVSHAFAGVAETGTLVLVSGEDNPTTLNFLPDDHIVVVDAADVVADYERVWTLLRGRYGKGEMPRTVNLVTGPSRSGDIEQILLMGAHGPRRVHIVIVDRDEV